jgi:hypothetical protein
MGGQHPLLAPNPISSTLTTSIPLPTSSWTSVIGSPTHTSTAGAVDVSSFANSSLSMDSPLGAKSLSRCPSSLGISSLSEFITTWAAILWHTITFGIFSHSRLQLQSSSKDSETQNGYFNQFSTTTNYSRMLRDQDDDDHALREIPQYVLDYAPYCYLFTEEEYWPGIMEEHLENTTPYLNYDPVSEDFRNPDLHNLHKLNEIGGRRIYLTSNDDPESYPYWLSGQDNIPEGWKSWDRKKMGDVKSSDNSNRSNAPVILIVVDKGDKVDAFWFFFYSFNLGNQVLGVRFGNHVGDWEHTMVRFKKGKPTEVFYSEHEWGSGYNWEDADKTGNRVCLFSSTNSFSELMST